MIDWQTIGDWITPDLGIGAVGGAIITGAVAILLDQRRRHDESKNRFSEEKLHAYEQIISVLDAAGETLLLFAEFAPLFRKLESGETLDEWHVDKQGQLNVRIDQIMKRHENDDSREETIVKLSLLGSYGAARASNRLMKVLFKMMAHIEAGNYEKVGKLAPKYEIASAIFLNEARSDMGIR